MVSSTCLIDFIELFSNFGYSLFGLADLVFYFFQFLFRLDSAESWFTDDIVYVDIFFVFGLMILRIFHIFLTKR